MRSKIQSVTFPTRARSRASGALILAAAALMGGGLASLALAQEPAKSFELSPGLVVDPATNRAYVMRPEGGIAALDLTQGEKLWQSSAAAKPLTVSGDLLVSQAEPKASDNALEIVTLNTDQGTAVLQQTVPLPPKVKPSITRSAGRSFNASADSTSGEAAVTWQFQERLIQGTRAGREVLPGEPGPSPGALPPGVLRTEQGESLADGPKTETANGAFRMNLKSGAVTPQKPGRRAAPVADKSLAVALSPAEQLAEVPQPQFLSADGRTVLNPTSAAGGSPWERYVWTIYDRATGARLGEFRNRVRYTPFFVSGSLVIFQTGPYERKTADGNVEEPLQLSAVDLKTGETVWTEPIRDTVERGALRP
jgi:PQQ-like domain